LRVQEWRRREQRKNGEKGGQTESCIHMSYRCASQNDLKATRKRRDSLKNCKRMSRFLLNSYPAPASSASPFVPPSLRNALANQVEPPKKGLE
jgi:hypothetical protein